MKTGIWIGIIIGAIVLSLILGSQLFPKEEIQIYTGERASFLLQEVGIFSWSDLEGACYSKFKDYANEFQAPHKICFMKRSGSGFTTSISKFNVACNCYGTNYNLRK